MVRATFICGCGHSGTTLLASILSTSPVVFMPRYETHIFLRDQPRAEMRQAFGELMRVARGDAKAHVVEKTPRHITRVRLIRRLVPQGRFVMPVRDGRDVVASLMRGRGLTLERATRRWVADTGRVLAERDAEDCLVYRHEDLVDDLERVVRRVCEHTGIPFEDRMLRWYEQEQRWSFDARWGEASGRRRRTPEHFERRNQQVNQPIFDSRGTWRETLADADVAPLLEGEALRVMQAFGYAD